jgi:hypothetical protein
MIVWEDDRAMTGSVFYLLVKKSYKVVRQRERSTKGGKREN